MSDLTVTVTRVIKAPIERVFQVWTEPQQMEQLYGPEDTETTDAASDNRVGGKYRFTMKVNGQEFKISGEYLEFDEPNKLVFTWGENTTVSIEFKKLDDNTTEVSLIHSGFDSEQSRDQHEQGWKSTLNKLVKHLTN